MMKLFLVAAGGLLLATANSPPAPEGELTSVVAAPAPAPAEAAPAPVKHAKHARHAYGAYPRCSAAVRDRCVQGRSRIAAPAHREMQLAMRAGERG